MLNAGLKGKICTLIGLALFIISLWIENVFTAFASGLSIAWGYWYWWRKWGLTFFKRKNEGEL